MMMFKDLTETQSRPALLSMLSQAGEYLADLVGVLERWRKEHESGMWSDACYKANTDPMKTRLLATARVVASWSAGESPAPVDVCEMLRPCEYIPPQDCD